MTELYAALMMTPKEDLRLQIENALNVFDTVELAIIDKALTEIHIAIWSAGNGEGIAENAR